ncbi:NUDIX domain-containing protein [Paenibacillus thiaminolyticus]|uniref:NUDIX domain-containing protein n=1 Tax=Paenibacillus thiaminolyticus TaxID=49283 RepID=UPI00232E93D7|nr:NUDIX domain-containing protein [Paenibacillus thiaminolyticus]WCF05962.1 NUDIX domain-containing protein [Paenibacillus thiaminolyticus]
MERIRDAVRALIMEDGRLLCIKKERPEVGVYYALPGGAHEPNEMLEEMLEETLRRECEEELGTSVADLGLLCVREDVSANHEYSHIEKAVHGVEFIYACRLQGQGEPGVAHADEGQNGSEWLPVRDVIATVEHSISRSGRGNMYSRRPSGC